jgi:hypothetical protein
VLTLVRPRDTLTCVHVYDGALGQFGDSAAETVQEYYANECNSHGPVGSKIVMLMVETLPVEQIDPTSPREALVERDPTNGTHVCIVVVRLR